MTFASPIGAVLTIQDEENRQKERKKKKQRKAVLKFLDQKGLVEDLVCNATILESEADAVIDYLKRRAEE